MSALVRTLLLTLAAGGALAAGGDAATAQLPPAAPPAARAPEQERDIEDFVPSEKVKADDAVSFPADI
jgi:hypothetical protein